ncbi:phage portal protein, PBSX family [Gulbenkiania indica]|uniref:Phage portal protein, PBSX family n=1 Tax=Gulbenkiania indica TaxID=375574 RepID=A0A0K6GUD1_9NEIS|nr:phage portal protein [Gulbenkiania indica]CUA82102.1 phage portal protein, PBSX family [Gulbenkiania indica]
MAKRRRPFTPPSGHQATPPSTESIEAFTFGDPTPVLDRREIMDYAECLSAGKWYEPPISWEGLARSWNAAVHHKSAIAVKRNVLVSTFRPHPLLTRSAFAQVVIDYLVFGNLFLQQVKNRLGGLLALDPAPAKFTRRGVDLSTYWWVPSYNQERQLDNVIHLMEHDINQEVYGLPEYLAALNSAWLNESATLFRRKYYLNGSHAGFILYMTDAAQQQGDVDALRKALKDSKGPGNFRNLFMYAPNGKKDGIQIIPISEVAAKDEFFNIKNVTRDDVLAAHRVPPQLMGIIPSNTGGFGDASKAAEVFYHNEILPLQTRLQEINEVVGQKVIDFGPYQLALSPAA